MVPRRSGKTVQWFRYSLLWCEHYTRSGRHGWKQQHALDRNSFGHGVLNTRTSSPFPLFLMKTAIDPIVQNAAEQLGYAAGLS